MITCELAFYRETSSELTKCSLIHCLSASLSPLKSGRPANATDPLLFPLHNLSIGCFGRFAVLWWDFFNESTSCPLEVVSSLGTTATGAMVRTVSFAMPLKISKLEASPSASYTIGILSRQGWSRGRFNCRLLVQCCRIRLSLRWLDGAQWDPGRRLTSHFKPDWVITFEFKVFVEPWAALDSLQRSEHSQILGTSLIQFRTFKFVLIFLVSYFHIQFVKKTFWKFPGFRGHLCY